jgi:tripartite-type tricarboxylate transporter receptor subunit TctC
MLNGLGAGTLGRLPSMRALAQAFPNRTVLIITPCPPGGGPAATLRLVSDRLAKKCDQPAQDKPGGNGFITVAAFKHGAADGYDLIEFDSNLITIHQHTFGKLPFDMANDFTLLCMILRTSFFVTVAADSPFKSIDDIVAAAKAEPGKVTDGVIE